MDDHLGILEERIEAVAVFGDGALQERERRRGEVDDGEKEDLYGGEDGAGVGVELDVGLVGQSKNKAVGGEQPCPEKQGAFLAAPQRGEFVGAGQGAVGVFEDVGDGEVVGEDGVDERERGGGNGDEASDSGTTCSVGEALGRDRGGLPRRNES